MKKIGIDWISFTANYGDPAISFPIYDCHGNMIYTLKRESGNNFSLNNRKVYDVWGSLRNGSGGAQQEHCANLGHRVDDESDLIYVRARYYEPWTGRFISEDPARDGLNWFVYCENNPVNYVDDSGKSPILIIWVEFVLASLLTAINTFWTPSDPVGRAAKSGVVNAIESILASLMAISFLNVDARSDITGSRVVGGLLASGLACLFFSLAMQSFMQALEISYGEENSCFFRESWRKWQN